jgi:hypothetical protein
MKDNQPQRGQGLPGSDCSRLRPTPDTDLMEFQFRDEDGVHLFAVHSEFARRIERERDAALAREAALLEFMEVEMGWEYFRAEYQIGDSPSQSLQNAKKVKEFLSANTECLASPAGSEPSKL